MRNFIINKMSEIFEDFENDLKEEPYLCTLKEFRFDSGNTPDYQIEMIQRYYLLRYMPAYLVEYYNMYKDMLRENFIEDELRVLSIGCGCGIDLWGLKFAVDDYEEPMQINYCGLDVVDWLYWDALGIDECYYLEDNINTMEMLDSDDYNIIIFPKSIGELDEETFNNLKNVFKNSRFTQDKIVLLSSVRKLRDKFDIDRFEEIINIFEEEHEFECLDDKRGYTYYEKDIYGDHPKLEDIFDEFVYPSDIRDFIISLNSCCAGFVQNDYEACEYDCNTMNRYPITRASQIRYQIVRLER